MALPILDGNQSATTLSSILTSGEHIPAHTVVSLGTQAITDMRGAVSGSVVSISNFPATQTVAGTVTAIGQANGTTLSSLFPIGIDTLFSGVRPITDLYGYRLPVSLGDSNAVVSASLSDPLPAGTNRIGVVTIGAGTVTIGAGTAQIGSVTASISGTVPISISSVTVGNSVTIGSLPLIAGTVTANAVLISPSYEQINAGIESYIGDYGALPISGTVTVGNTVTIAGTVTANVPLSDISGGITDYISGTDSFVVSPLGGVTFPISGTVTANVSSQDLYGQQATTAGSFLRSALYYEDLLAGAGEFLRVNNDNDGGLPIRTVGTDLVNVSGTVTANINTFPDATTIGEQIAQGFTNYGSFDVAISGTANVSGTVTLGASSSQIGSVTASISNSVTIASFATSVTARLINPAGTAVTYAEVGTAGSPSIDVLSVQGVSGGTSLLIGGTTGSFTTRFGSVTTANTAQISTAVTNLSRKYLFVQNVTTSSNVITVGIGFTPTTTQGIQLAAGALIDFESSFIPTGAVYILSSVTGSPFTILEA